MKVQEATCILSSVSAKTLKVLHITSTYIQVKVL